MGPNECHGPKCPECGRPTGLYPLNTHKKNRVPGSTVLFFCCDEAGCGWSETGDIPVPEAIKYMVHSGRGGGAFDLSRVRKPLTQPLK
jgi:hypothetical protein